MLLAASRTISTLSGIPTATEAVKSNALMRCCKDLGVASELWYDFLEILLFPFFSFSAHRDPRFIREFKAKHCVEVFAENTTTKKKYVVEFCCAFLC